MNDTRRFNEGGPIPTESPVRMQAGERLWSRDGRVYEWTGSKLVPVRIMREAVAIWDRSQFKWTVHEIVTERDERRSDDLVLHDSVGEVRLRADEIAAISGEIMARHAGAAKVELDNMMEKKGYDLRKWLAEDVQQPDL